jgi:hypothetical protein
MIKFKAYIAEKHGAGEEGTDELVNKYKKDTPTQPVNASKKQTKNK